MALTACFMAASFARDNICKDGTDVVNEPIPGERRGRGCRFIRGPKHLTGGYRRSQRANPGEGGANSCRDQNLSICTGPLPNCTALCQPTQPTFHSSHPTSFLQSRHPNDHPGSIQCAKIVSNCTPESNFKCGQIYKSMEACLCNESPNVQPFSAA